MPRIAVVYDVDLCLRRQTEHRYERRRWSSANTRDRLFVGCDQRALVLRQALRTKQHLRGTQHIRVFAAIERIAQDNMRELGKKQRRELNAARPERRRIRRFESWIAQEAIAELDHHLPVLACIRVSQRRNFIGLYRPSWFC